MDLLPERRCAKQVEVPYRETPLPSGASSCASGAALEDGGKKPVGAMTVGPDLEIFAHIEVDALFLKDVYGGYQPKLRVARQKCLCDVAIFLIEDAAGRVDKPPPRLHQPGRRGEQRRLLARQLHQLLGRLAPFPRRGAAARC